MEIGANKLQFLLQRGKLFVLPAAGSDRLRQLHHELFGLLWRCGNNGKQGVQAVERKCAFTWLSTHRARFANALSAVLLFHAPCAGSRKRCTALHALQDEGTKKSIGPKLLR